MFSWSFAALPDEWDLQDLENFYTDNCVGKANTAQEDKYKYRNTFKNILELKL